MKELGRDGAYVECEAKALYATVKPDVPPKMLTLTATRLELTEEKQVELLCRLMKWMEGQPETAGMNDEQKSFYLFRRIFEYGLTVLHDEE